MIGRAGLSAVVVILVLVAGCERGAPDHPSTTAKGVASSRTYALKGVVRKVDAASSEITIAHQEIPGFMAKMTMPFTVKNKALLEDVQPGDEVEGSLQVDSLGSEIKDMMLIELTVTRPSMSSSAPALLPETTVPVTLRLGEPVPDFTVTTQDGKPLRLSEMKGDVVVLTFIYTRCPSPEFCPAMDAKFAELARRISIVPGRADRIRLLSISFDPEHDTPEVLAAHAARRGAKPPLWTFSVASGETLGKIGGLLGLTYVPGTREIDHNLRTAVIGPDGRLARLEAGPGWAPADLLKEVYALIPSFRK